MGYRTRLPNTPRIVVGTVKRLCLWLALLCGPILHAQTTYYLSEVNGNDSYPTNTLATPWRTIAHFKQQVPTIQSNTTITFERGGRYNGALKVIGRTGVRFEAYGTGARPIIRGGTEILPTDWTAWATVGGLTIYRCGLFQSEPLGTPVQYLDIDMVFGSNGVRTLARYPNVDDPAHPDGWLRLDVDSDQGVILDSELTEATDYWKDATAVVRSANWSYDLCLVGSSSLNTLQLAVPMTNDPKDVDWGYFLRDKYALLDQVGEWYYEDVPGIGNDQLYYVGLLASYLRG